MKMENNVYTELAKARYEFTKLNVKPTGSGQAGSKKFSFYSLDDILPRVNRIFSELSLLQFSTITNEKAIMTIIHGPSDSQVSFEIPYAQWVGQAATDPIMQLGGTLSYLTRYLWYTVMNIAEFDLVDGEVKIAEEVKNAVQKQEKYTSNNDTQPQQNKSSEKVEQYTGKIPGDLYYKQFPFDFEEGSGEYQISYDKNNKSWSWKLKQIINGDPIKEFPTELI